MSIVEDKSISELQNILERARCTGYLNYFQEEDRRKFLLDVRARIDEFQREYGRRFGESVDPAELLDRNPNKGSAFYQWVAGENLSIEICVALWRILCGASILGLTYRYQREKESVIELELQPLRGGVPDKYKSESRDDFRILAELRMIAFDGKPHLIGAFRPVH